MADPFEGSARGPGEEAHEGFKIFGMSVNQFSAAVAGADALLNTLGKQLNQAGRAEKAAQAKEIDVAKTQDEAAKKQVDAADIHADLAKEAKKQAKTKGKSEAKAWGQMLISAKSFREAADVFMIGVGEMAKKIGDAVKKATGRAGGGMQEFMSASFGKFTGFIKNIGGIIKSFSARFIVAFTLVNILTRILEKLVAGETMVAQSRRVFGNQVSGQMTAQFQAAQAGMVGMQTVLENAEFLDIQRQINAELMDSRDLTGNMAANVKLMAEGLNMDVGSAAAFMGRALRTSKATADDVYATFADTASVAAAAGLNVDELTQSLTANVDLAQQFNLATSQGRLLLARSAAEARLLGTDLSAVRGFGDSMFDISNAAETAARLQAAGLGGFSASRLVTGAMDDPSALMRDMITDIQKQYGSLDSTRGADRATIAMLMQQIPQLGELFGSIEGVSKAIGVAGSGDLKKVEQEVAAAQERANEAKNYEVNALANLKELVVQGKSLETQFNNLAENISQKIADWLQGPFNQLLGWIRDLVDMVANSKFFSKTDAMKQREADAKAVSKSTTKYMEDKIRDNPRYFDSDGDNDITAAEITKRISDTIARQREQGTEITDEQQAKMVQAVMELVEIQKEEIHKGHKVTFSDIRGRTWANGMYGRDTWIGK